MIVTVRRCRCALAFLLLLALGSLGARSAEAAIYYVGTGPTCGDQPNDRPSLAAALLSAAFTTANDEIRLTGTLTYANQALSLVDWHAGVAGTLTLAGGYTDCDDAGASGRTALSGQAGDSLIAVTTASQPTSVVTLRALELSGAEFRGVVVGDGAQVTLQNVWIHDNAGGVLVSSGGELSGDSATEVTDNELTLNGGGISQAHFTMSLIAMIQKIDLKWKAPASHVVVEILQVRIISHTLKMRFPAVVLGQHARECGFPRADVSGDRDEKLS